ncbi:unnamed protein product [Prorocentrum cordatum]|uniref:Uncharacterized protein n=1 Tax=Prorocentrum cordatum TaxID=2364126 RepID=A0ABN9SKW7_9DINO|nr:unnamed protein product [Polarella glacialis]
MVDELHNSEESAWAPDEVEKIVVETLDGHLKEQQYDQEQVPHWINHICETVMAKLSETKDKALQVRCHMCHYAAEWCGHTQCNFLLLGRWNGRVLDLRVAP